LDDVDVSQPASAGEPIAVRIRTRFNPELGSGRPEEVVAALAEAMGSELVVSRIVRQRLLLIEDVPPRARP
ncbi:MAG TPA: hypothetical protein VIM39_00470, partial [Candidatus Limnocylindrales bacterium]